MSIDAGRRSGPGQPRVTTARARGPVRRAPAAHVLGPHVLARPDDPRVAAAAHAASHAARFRAVEPTPRQPWTARLVLVLVALVLAAGLVVLATI